LLNTTLQSRKQTPLIYEADLKRYGEKINSANTLNLIIYKKISHWEYRLIYFISCERWNWLWTKLFLL